MLFKQSFSGIDFRDQHLALATITMNKKKPVLTKVEYKRIDDHYVQGNRVDDPEMLTAALRESLVKSKTLAKRAHLAIPTLHVILRKITSLPDLPEKVLGRLLHFQLGESIHLPFDKPIFDYHKLGTVLAEGEKRSEVLFFATNHDLAQDLLTCVEQAGLKVLSAEIRGLALQRLISYLHPDWLAESEVVLDIDDQYVDLHIFKQHTILFSRSMPLAKDDYYVQLFDKQATWDEERYMFDLLNQIEKAENFYRYSMDERETQFKRMIITGDFSTSIFQKLTEQLAYPVNRLRYTPLLPSSSVENMQNLDACSVAIGLALRGKKKLINKRTDKLGEPMCYTDRSEPGANQH